MTKALHTTQDTVSRPSPREARAGRGLGRGAALHEWHHTVPSETAFKQAFSELDAAEAKLKGATP